MSSSTLKIVTVVLVLLALLLAGVSYRVFRGYAEEAKAATEQAKKESTPQTLAVVAVKPLAAYKVVDRESVALVPVTIAPQQYFTNLDEVVGKTPLVDVDAGAPVTARYFAEGNVLAKVIPGGFQAISVEISDVIAVGGFVRPGDIVDVLLFVRGGNGTEQAQSRVLLKDIRVLAYEERIIDRPQGLKDDDKSANQQPRRSRTAVLAIADADTTRMMLGVSLGDIRLALHGQKAADQPVAENGLPLSKEAVAALEKNKVPDKLLTASELTQIKKSVASHAAVAPSVEIYRGSQLDRVAAH
jgi:pilus assembly protein CpaB